MENKNVLAIGATLTALALGAGEWSRQYEEARIVAEVETSRVSPDHMEQITSLIEHYRELCMTMPNEDILDGNTSALDQIEMDRTRILTEAGLPDSDWDCWPDFDEVGGVPDFFADSSF